MKDHVYHYEKIVIGGDLRAIIFAYYNSLPLVFVNLQEPKFYERFRWNLDLASLGIKNLATSLNTPNGPWTYGVQKNKIWRHLLYILSMSGLVPLSDKVQKLRIEDNNILKVTTEHSRMIKLSFDKIVVFDNESLEGFPAPHASDDPQKVYKVLDWMNVRSGMSHPYDVIERDDTFVTQIYFYPSERIDGNHRDKKDLVAISYLTKDEMNDFQFSDTYARFKVCDLMKKSGIRGKKNGKDPNNPEKHKHYAIKVEAFKREIIPLPETDFPEMEEEKDNLLIVRMTDEELIEWRFDGPNQKLKKLSSCLWKL